MTQNQFPPQQNQYQPQGGGFPQNTPPQTPPPVQAAPGAMPSLADEIASAGGVPSFFKRESKIGDTVQGPVIASEMIHSTDFDTGQLEHWDDGQPKMKVRVTLQTDIRDPQDPNDDGHRTVYINWWGENRKALLAAINAAVTNPADKDIKVGGYFGAQYVEDRPNEKRPHLNPAKIYQYWYQPPTPGAGLAGLPGMEQPQQPPAAAQPPVQQPPAQAPAAPVPAAQHQQPPAQDPWTGGAPQQQQPPQQQPPAAAPAAPAGPDQQIIKFIGLGLSDEEIAGATGVTPAQVAAVRATQ